MFQVGRSELQSKSLSEIITLFINRRNGTDFSSKQLDFVESYLTTKDDKEIVQITVNPRPETGWVNGPVVIDFPVLDLGDLYADFTLTLKYSDVISGRDIPQLLRYAGGPPTKPLSIELKHVDLGNSENKYLNVSYSLRYENVFFNGELELLIDEAPNTLKAFNALEKILPYQPTSD